MGTEEQYWYNTETGEVEVGRRSSWTHLMGPYGTRAEAQRALESAKARSESWEQDDKEWRDNK